METSHMIQTKTGRPQPLSELRMYGRGNWGLEPAVFSLDCRANIAHNSQCVGSPERGPRV